MARPTILRAEAARALEKMTRLASGGIMLEYNAERDEYRCMGRAGGKEFIGQSTDFYRAIIAAAEVVERTGGHDD